MSLSASGQAVAGKGSANLIAFPGDRILRARSAAGPEVTVIQAGLVTVFATEADLAAAFREHDPALRAGLAQVTESLGRAQALEAQAEQTLELTRAAHRRAEAVLADAREGVARQRRGRRQLGILLLFAALAGVAAALAAFALKP